MNIVLAILLGGLFGFALYIVGATDRINIKKMLSLKNLTLAKTILFAIGFASVLLSISAMIGIFDISHLNVKPMHLGVICGGIIFGIGFGSIGTCPGTCIGAIGGKRGVKKALMAIVGGLFGAFTFSMIYGNLKDKGFFDMVNWGSITLFNISNKYPSVFNFSYIGLLFTGVIFMLGAYYMPEKLR